MLRERRIPLPGEAPPDACRMTLSASLSFDRRAVLGSAALSRRGRSSSGYSLVEIIIATLVFVVAGAGAVSLFTLVTRQASMTQSQQEEQFATAIDEGAILRLNDRYSCASGACTVGTSTVSPGENGYYPDQLAAVNSFKALCNALTSANRSLVDDLVTQIQSLPVTTQMTRLGVSRQVNEELETVAPLAHRYRVAWISRDGEVLRQITLTPTAAAWCP
jgi:type II secretory pathway pseudopilin PulG